MGPVEAIKSGFTKSFQFSGRASRSEFWWFFPVALLAPIVVGASFLEILKGPWNFWWTTAVLLSALPILAAGSRRLHDMGEEGHQIIYPFMPFVFLWIGYIGTVLFGLAAGYVGGAGIGFILLVLLVIGFGLAYIFAVFASLMLIGPTIGMLIVPSEPKTNRFGPNPNEVPS